MKLNKFLLVVLVIVCLPVVALAETGTGAASGGLGNWAAAIAIGMAALGAALGQGKAINAGLEAIGRNPGAAGQIFTPFIIGLVFVEAIFVLSFVIAFQLLPK